MTPEQKFARWVRVSIASFLLMFVYFIVADIWIPLTPDATVMRVVTPVSARVSGYVAAVHVHNNSQVKKGDVLFELIPRLFAIRSRPLKLPWSRRVWLTNSLMRKSPARRPA